MRMMENACIGTGRLFPHCSECEDEVLDIGSSESGGDEEEDGEDDEGELIVDDDRDMESEPVAITAARAAASPPGISLLVGPMLVDVDDGTDSSYADEEDEDDLDEDEEEEEPAVSKAGRAPQ